MPSVIMLRVFYSECHYQVYCAEHHYAECHKNKCCHAVSRGTPQNPNKGCHENQHKAIQHFNTQHNNIQHNNT